MRRRQSLGNWIVFNDSVPHEVKHDGTNPRCVLIIDIWHIDLTNIERWAITSAQKLAAMEETGLACCWILRYVVHLNLQQAKSQ